MKGINPLARPLSRSRLKLLLSLKHGKHRDRTGLFIIEGYRGVREALRHGRVEEVYLSEGKRFEGLEELIAGDLSPVELEEGTFRQIASTVTPQGIAALCRLPQWSWDQIGERSGPLMVVDGVQDPGNMGSMLRAGWALGARGALIGPGSADPFGPGSVRGSMGAVFTLPMLASRDLNADLARLKKLDYAVFLADPSGDEELGDLTEVPPDNAVILGNEARGPSSKVLALADRRIRIEQDEASDSLNVAAAAAIILHHFKLIAARKPGRRRSPHGRPGRR